MKKIKNKIFRLRSKRIVSAVLVFTIIFSLFYYRSVQAAALTTLSDTMSRLDNNTASNHTIRFTTATAVNADADTITITFPSGFAVGSVDYTDIDLSHGASTGYETEETLAAANGAGTWGASFVGLVLTLDAPTDAGTSEIPAGDKVIVEIGTNASSGNAQMTNPNSTGTYVIGIGGTFEDSGQIAVAIITDDQVVVSTTIDPYLTFAISQNTVSLTRSGGGNPDYSNTGYNNGTANTLQAATNGVSGYTITYNGSTLTSGASTIDAMGTRTTSATNTEQFGINLRDNATPNTGANPSGGTGAPASNYNTVDEYYFAADTTTTLASASAATTTTTYTVSYIANVSQTTEAGAYSTTITYIATGNF